MRPQQAGLQPDRFLEKLGALREPILPKANGAQHRTGDGSGFRIGKGQPRLLVGLLKPALLDQGRGFLEGLDRLRARAAPEAKAGHESHAKATTAGRLSLAMQGLAYPETARPSQEIVLGGPDEAASAPGSMRPMESVVEPHTQLNRSRLVGLTAHQAEGAGAEVPFRTQEGRPVEDVAELRFEPQPRALGDLEALGDVDVLVEDLEPARRSVSSRRIAEGERARVGPGVPVEVPVRVRVEVPPCRHGVAAGGVGPLLAVEEEAPRGHWT